VITIYGKPFCPECEKAKNMLNNMDIPYDYKDISKDEEAREYILNLGLRSLPQCFDDDIYIGNAEDLSCYLSI